MRISNTDNIMCGSISTRAGGTNTEPIGVGSGNCSNSINSTDNNDALINDTLVGGGSGA